MELEQRGEERCKEDYIYIKGPYYAPVQVHTCSACLFKTPPSLTNSPVCPDWSALSSLRKQRPLCFHISSTGVFKMPRPFWGRG